MLGAQIVRRDDRSIGLATHTEMRARAAGFAYRLGIASTLIISGGHNVGVRYCLRDNKIFEKPNLSRFSRIKALSRPSEARIMADFLHRNYAVPLNAMVLEEESADTKQNAVDCARIVMRLGIDKIGLVTSLYHMEQAATFFNEVGLDVKPLYAEDLLIREDPAWIDRIVKFYSTPRGGRRWNTEQMQNNLRRGKSIAEALTQI